jgi:P4 family phage/plasmid primase-like protien
MINLKEAYRFLQVLEQDGQFTFLTFDDKKEGKVPVREFHGTFEEHAEDLEQMNESGAGIFVAVNETNLKGRKTPDIIRVRAHFIDSDEEPIEDVCRRFSLKPHMMVETSEGKGHAYYLVADAKLEEFKMVQEKLIEALGTDPAVKDLSRTMRLPGFFHMKKEPRLVKLIHVETGLNPYMRDDFINALHVDVPVMNKMAQPIKADPSIPLGDGYRTETLTSLAGSLISKGMSDAEVLNWMTLWNNNNIVRLPEDKIYSTIQSIRRSDQHHHPERYGRDLEYTDAGNSKRFVKALGDIVRFCHDRNDWMFWDGRRWIWDTENEIQQKAMNVASGIESDACNTMSASEINKINRWTKHSLSKSGLSNMIALAQSDRAIATTSSRLDLNDWLLNVNNGTIDLKDIDFRTHSRTDMITKMAPVTYMPGAKYLTWMKFMDTIFDGDQELISWLQKVAGYALTGSLEEQCVFFLIGDGSNGKSTFLNTLKRILGDYAVQANPDSFMVNKFSSAGAARADLLRLAGARMTIASEGEDGQQLAESFIKQITGGEEISTRGLYSKYQTEFLPKFKLFFCSNHKPRISGTDHGIWRRIRVIPFNVIIPDKDCDPNMSEKLFHEASGILNWALEGCLRWQTEGLKDVPASVIKASMDYRAENDVIDRFMNECVCKGDGKIYSSQLYKAYTDWSQVNGESHFVY